MTIKKAIRKIHLWLGLVSGAIVTVSMFAAAVFVWDYELTHWYYHDYISIKPAATPPKSLTLLLQNAQKTVSNKPVYGVTIPNDVNRAYMFYTYKDNPNPQGLTHWDDYQYWDNIYVNPYTGEVTGTVNMLYNWIDLTRRLHQNLLLRYDIGHYIVGFSTLFVIVLALTGIVLWFPRNKAALKQRFSIKWNASWRRVNYDLHNVGGFYANLLILLLAVTGLVWTFDWWTDGIYRLLGDNPDTVFKQEEHPKPRPLSAGAANPFDVALEDLKTKRAAWREISLYFPDPTAKEPAHEFSAYLSHNLSAWDDSDSYYYHPQTGKLIHQVTQEQKTIGEKWRNSNYAIHVGSIYGMGTKILASFAALFLASLPVTGFLIWWGRRKKVPKKTGRPGTKPKVVLTK